MERRDYPAEFRCKVLGLLAEGKSVASLAHDLNISEQTTYSWRRQDRIDRGLQPGLKTAENPELTKARQRITELETELAISRLARDKEQIREKHPGVGGLILALTDEPQSTTAWNTGALGEEPLG